MKLDTVKIGFGFVGSGFSWFFGGWDALLQYLLLFMVLDYATGIIRSGIQGRIASKVGFRGLARKVGILVIVGVAQGLDMLLADQQANILGIDMPMIRTLVIWGYIANEVSSILENVKEMGVPVHPSLEKVLNLIQDKNQK